MNIITTFLFKSYWETVQLYYLTMTFSRAHVTVVFSIFYIEANLKVLYLKTKIGQSILKHCTMFKVLENAI